MPAWSTEVANELIALALADRRPVDQSKLQRLVYIAHGHWLSVTGQPLTGDRPEAWEYGPVYRRLADALAGWGNRPVTKKIEIPDHSRIAPARMTANQSDLDQSERLVLERIYAAYALMTNAQLAMLTCGKGSPWEAVLNRAADRKGEIAHELIRKQFESFAEPSATGAAPDNLD